MPAATFPNVRYCRPEVDRQRRKWQLIRDCIDGQEAVKDAGTKYLPMPNAEDTSDENKKRYESYRQRAVFYNVTKRTLDGLVGQVFLRDPHRVIPKPLEMMLEDVDGAGVSFEDQPKKTLADTLSFGRVGLLTDYPPTTEAASLADLESGFIRPTINLYQPEEILNWRIRITGSKKFLSLVVLQEVIEEDVDGFQPAEIIQWRVLRLNPYYTVELWREVTVTPADVNNPQLAQPKQILELHAEYVPLNSDGRPFDEIPFTFIGSVNNDAQVDPPPLYDLAVLNIAHYRNSADYEESSFLTGQPTLWASGLTEGWVKDVFKGKILLGSRAALPLPQGGQAGLLQVNPNSMPKEAMDHKERQMVALGARLVQQRDVQRTLGEAEIEEAAETSILSSVAKNVSAAYLRCLKWACMFVGVAEEPEFKLNTDFPAARMTPDERAELIAEWVAEAISFTEMRAALRKAGVASLDDKVAQADIQKNPPPKPPAPAGGSSNGSASPRQNSKTQVKPRQRPK